MNNNNNRAVQLTERQIFWIKLIATLVLIAIVIAGFYVSFGTLVAFAAMFGKVGEAAIIVALIIDTLAVLGLGVTLLFPSASSKLAFFSGVGASSIMNLYIGFTVAGPIGALVAVVPQLSMILGERVVFDLIFAGTATTTTEAPVEVHQELEDGLEELEVLEDFVEPTLVVVEDTSEEFWVVPDTVEELQEEIPAPVEPTRASRQEIVKVLQQEDGTPPGRPAIMKRFGCSDWVARKVLEELKA